jgi:tetratricopeptide (TPR) repeat protein
VLATAGNVYAGLDETQVAFDYYERALELNPGSASILTSIAGLLLREGQYDSAAAMAAKAIEQSPGIIDPPWHNGYVTLGEAMTHLQRTDEYIDILEDAADRYGQDNPLFFEALGDEQRLAGRFQEAISSYQRRVEIKRHIVPLMGIGMAQWLEGDAEDALNTFYDAFADAAWGDSWRWETRVISLLKYLRRYDDIEQRFDRLREKAGNMSGWFTVGYDVSMGRYDDALAALEGMSGTSGATWELDVVMMTVGVYRQKGDISKAKEILRESEGSWPVWWESWGDIERATLAAIEGDMDGAVDFAEKAFEGQAGSRLHDLVVAFLARLQFAAGQTDRALAALERVRGEHADYLAAALYLRAQLETASEYGRAEEYLKKAQFFATRAAREVKSSVDLSSARCYCALAAARLGDSEGTRSNIEYARRLEPERPDVAYFAACAYALIGDATLAVQWLETSVERGHQELWWARVDPDLDALRELPRFQEIMADWDRRMSAMID